MTAKSSVSWGFLRFLLVCATSFAGACAGRVVVGVARVGVVCTTDADCGSGLRCVLARDVMFGGGGPANGYCSAPCDGNEAICDPYGAVCAKYIDGNSGAWCIKTCASADPPDVKCGGRDDVGCLVIPSTMGPSVCVPRCANDAECGAPLTCDPSTGMCITGSRSGAPTGAACGPEEDVCDGRCLLAGDYPGDPGVCGSYCVIGRVDACGRDPSEPLVAGKDPLAACMPYFPYSSSPGDLGACRQLCDSDADCLDQSGATHCNLDTRNVTWGHGICETRP